MHEFQVGKHVVRVSETDQRWRVSVDDVSLSRWFRTGADAWTAGVHEADRLDREAVAVPRLVTVSAAD